MSISRSNRPATAAFGSTLRQARRDHGWSQRDLSARSGLPQSQISKIETGDVDPQASTLVELARFLDLELQLVPRGAVAAVEVAVREAQARTTRRDMNQSLDELGAVVDGVSRGRPDLPEAADLQSVLAALRREADALDSATARYGLTEAATRLKDLWRGGPDRIEAHDLETLRRTLDSVRIAHERTPARPRPAYSLDEEDDAS